MLGENPKEGEAHAEEFAPLHLSGLRNVDSELGKLCCAVPGLKVCGLPGTPLCSPASEPGLL